MSNHLPKMSTTKPVLLVLLLLLLAVSSFPQEYSYVQYNTQNGLAGSTVYDAVQDKDGFIWFATESGVSRFDGTNFKNFTTKDGLPDDEVLKLFVDSKNRIWMVPFKQSVCYYEKGKIHTQKNDVVLRKFHLNREVVTIIEGSDGNILIQEPVALHIISPEGKVNSLYKNGKDSIYTSLAGANKSKGFEVVSPVKNSFTLFSVSENQLTNIRTIFSNLGPFASCKGLLTNNWEIFINSDTIDVLSLSRGNHYQIPFRYIDLINFSELNDSIFLINSRNGTFAYSYKSNLSEQHFLKGFSTTSSFQDNEGSFWFTTLDDGVFKLPNTGFQTISIGMKNNAKSTPIYSIEKFQEKIFFGSNINTVYTLDIKSGVISDSVKLDKSGGDSRIVAIKGDEIRQRLYLATGGGIAFINQFPGKYKYLVPARTIKSLDIYDNELIASSHDGAWVININNPSMFTKIWNGRATATTKILSHYFIGTLDGLYEYTPGLKAAFLGHKFSSLQSRVIALASANDNILWVATHGNGLIGFRGGEILYSFTTDNGLVSNTCRSLFYKNGILWIGTDKGINKITFKNEQVKIIKYTISDGLPSNMINAIYVDSNIVYVGTPKGLTFFDETQISKQSVCLLRMLKINVGNKFFADNAKEIRIQKKETINFEFVGISFKSAGDINYYYKLEGFDTAGKETNQNSLHFLSLPAGDYTLHLKAINKFGVESNTISYSFTVEKDFLEKTWVRILLLAAFILFTWLIAKAVLNRTRRLDAEKMQTQERILQLEQMALRSQMNPHFIFNSLNSIQQFVIDKDIAGANKYISSFSRLIRQTLDNSSKEYISLAEEISYLTNYLQLEKTRTEDAFEYIFTVDDSVATDEISIPPMLLQPYIENAIRHGIRYRKDKKGRIDINISIQENNLICIITDNGIGRKLSQSYKGTRNIEYQSKGTALTAERINIINTSREEKIEVRFEDLEDTHGVPLGTRVHLRFPVEKK